MILRQIAEEAPYYLVTKIGECPLDRFWVAQLDDGFSIYEDIDDVNLDESNAWMRLKAFCIAYNIKILNMSVANKNPNPNTQIDMSPSADGYFYSRRIRHLMTADPRYTGYNDMACGIGELHGNILKITWELNDGRIEIEERDINDHPKSKTGSLIRK